MVKEAIQRYGRIDMLVNNAMVGRYFLKSFLETTWDDFTEKFNDEIKAAYEVTRAVIPDMVKQNYGRIIYVATGSAKFPNPPGAIAFRTAKAGLTFAKYIAQEFGRKGITANIVSPGLVETDQNVHFPAEIKQQYASLTTIGRTGKPEDVANVIAFFASDESGYMTGTYAPVDGDLLLVDNNNNDNDNSNSNNNLVQNLVDSFRDAFNIHDPKMLSSLLNEDGEWTDVIGYTMIGRNEIENQHVYPFTTVLKEAKLDVKSYRSKWVTDEIVSVDIKWESVVHRTPEGKPIPTTRYGLLNLIAKKVKEEGVDTILKIIIARNNDYTSTYTQSDRERIVKQKKNK